ncbi:MAG: bifunctional isocitrate dehydrogenase kinase/phosphatase [Gammaproteobacteria bacterium]|nr:bifunctional isocitrate dehydrogenase kinase/phosphatase [Gammaproteobacteria bacterium]
MDKVTDIAQTILDGFNRHYWLFREISASATNHFENGDWQSIVDANRTRIDMYDQRVHECVEKVLNQFPTSEQDENLWPQIKLAFIGLLYQHLQPECAETFFNSVACRVLHRSYYHNEYIFWRPAISTEHLEGDEPIYRCYYPGSSGLKRCLLEMLIDFTLQNRFENLRWDIRLLRTEFDKNSLASQRRHPNHQLQVLGSLFFRNKCAYIVGREIIGNDIRGFIIPILQDDNGMLFVDTILFENEYISVLFSFSRAYFLVDMEVPSAYVQFLQSIMPNKPVLELYSMLGLQKQSKTMFYRELHHHLKYSSDSFIESYGIKGMVMLVFTLPSFPFVFKIIRDQFEAPKEGNRDLVMQKYLLVKHHDRVGRLADTLEYSHVALPLDRIDNELLEELKSQTASSIEIDDGVLILKHVYIERRMTPLNEYLSKADEKQKRHAIIDYGNAIRDLAGANIFPGDMMLKNFGLTRHNRVVFYDYDEICYMTECNFRRIPPATSFEDEMSSQPCYSVGPNDVFPEQFTEFFFSDADSKDIFQQIHGELTEPEFWRQHQEKIIGGQQADVFPYPESIRFRNQHQQKQRFNDDTPAVAAVA